jgi:hypothetical protein
VKNTLQINFQTNEPISSNNKSIDSAQQAETHRNLKNISKFVLGKQAENLREKIPLLKNFSTVQSIFTNSILVDSSQQGEQN